MDRPLLLYLANVSEALPLVAAAASLRPVRGARGWVVAWCVVEMGTAYVALYLGLHHRSNLWLGYVSTPLAAALALWGLSCFQTRELARVTMRFLIPAALVVWAVLTAAFENTSTFSRAAEPMLSLVCVGAAATTLLLRSAGSRGSLLGQDWFWISAGFALYYAAWSAVGPLSTLLVGGSLKVFGEAYQLTSVLEIVAMVLMARGMACPVET